MKTGIRQFGKQAAVYASLCLLSVFYGVYAHQQHHDFAILAEQALEAQLTLFRKPWYLLDAPGKEKARTVLPQAMQPGLTKLVHFSGEKSLAVSVIDNTGTVVQQWPLDWFTLWPDADHLSWFMQPRSRPGTTVHGAEILPDASLVFNFEYLGMLKLDACGKVQWRLPYQTHHSVFIDEQGFIWAGANRVRRGETLQQPLHDPYYVEPFILRISPDGRVVEEKSLMQLLHDNGLDGALYLATAENEKPVVRGDTLHLNDVEVFPSTLAAGFFQPSDVMVSLRNANLVLVFDRQWQLKYNISNLFTRQHDPDFIDGNTISVFDNNNRFADGDAQAHSRILSIRVPGNQVQVLFAGNPQVPFFTRILGKQQRLVNGNLLLSEGRGGRLLEVSPDGRLVWEYTNLLAPDTAAILHEGERLPPAMDAAFFAEQRRRCGQGDRDA